MSDEIFDHDDFDVGDEFSALPAEGQHLDESDIPAGAFTEPTDDEPVFDPLMPDDLS